MAACRGVRSGRRNDPRVTALRSARASPQADAPEAAAAAAAIAAAAAMPLTALGEASPPPAPASAAAGAAAGRILKPGTRGCVFGERPARR